MEKVYELQIGDNSFVSMQTEKIKGILDVMIIDAEAKTELIIESELGYVILANREVYGTNYYPIRARSIDEKGWGANYQNVPFNLNEKLLIGASGQKGKRIKIRMRFF